MEEITQVPKLQARKADCHKGDFGRVGIVGGSVGMAGAVVLCGTSALRAGAGLVRIATAVSAQATVAAGQACCMTAGLAEDDAGMISGDAVDDVLELAGASDVIGFGPGVGVSAGVKLVLERLIAVEGVKLVVDADGLNCLAKIGRWADMATADMVLTPHPGEMRRIWGSVFRGDLPGDRKTQAIKLAKATGAVVVLKGAATVVSDGERVYVNTTGNAGMATAGSGDVLTGAICALRAQGLSGFDAAVLGVYIHGLAGDIAAERLGQVSLIATDIIDELGAAFLRYCKK